MDSIGLSIALNIKMRLTVLGFTQKELAKRARITEQGLSKIMQGRQPRPATLAVIAQILETTPEELARENRVITKAEELPAETKAEVEKAIQRINNWAESEIFAEWREMKGKLKSIEKRPLMRRLVEIASTLDDEQLDILCDQAEALIEDNENEGKKPG